MALTYSAEKFDTISANIKDQLNHLADEILNMSNSVYTVNSAGEEMPPYEAMDMVIRNIDQFDSILEKIHDFGMDLKNIVIDMKIAIGKQEKLAQKLIEWQS